MHARSPYYASPPDFAKLSREYLSLQKFVDGNHVDFKDPAAALEVTKCLLLHDFQIQIELPDDRLCPPVPNRLNYILWIEDILTETQDPDEQEQTVVGVDIGTGASAIYSLLACRRNSTWKMFALESDVKSLTWARKNVSMNPSLEDRIDILTAYTNRALLLQHDIIETEDNISFTMCNPPFYANQEEIDASRRDKQEDSKSINTGSSSELITPGGEVEFTRLQIVDSLVLRTRVRWYSTMLGKKESLIKVVDMMRHHEIGNYAVTELTQGQTRRWAIAWSFLPWRPSVGSSRCATSTSLDLGPFNPVVVVSVSEKVEKSIDVVLDQFFQEASLNWQWITIKQSRMILVHENTWSRQARRKQAKRTLDSVPGDINLESPPSVKMRVQINYSSGSGQAELLWRYGLDHSLFESFCGKMKQLLK